MMRFDNHEVFRNDLVEDLRGQLLGPVSTDSDSRKCEIIAVSPLQLYATGVLFPQRLRQILLEDAPPDSGQPEGGVEENEALADVKLDVKANKNGSSADEGALTAEREPLNLANEFSPSALGISFRLQRPTRLSVELSYGTYSAQKRSEPHPRAGEVGMDGRPFPTTREVIEYRRAHHRHTLLIAVSDKSGGLEPIEIEGPESGLKLHVTIRKRIDGSIIVSTMAVNCRVAAPEVVSSHDDAFFQVELIVRQEVGQPVFVPIDREVGENLSDDEIASLELLYRHRRAFALGHGVAGDWNRDEGLSESGATDMVRTSAIPVYELKPIRPRERPFGQGNPNLSMSFLFDADGEKEQESKVLESLEALASDYEAWIESISGVTKDIDPSLAPAAQSNIESCRECHSRMVMGIAELRSNSKAMLAFRLMNRAMLMQQVHSQTFRFRELDAPPAGVVEDYRSPPGGTRKWRPFQLAFILMNIVGMCSPAHPERALVDLIWFPTGGGKTEAYLGLAAFAICYERMAGEVPGTVVLMRYTLRLLTAQQFQRAATLVLALEIMRKESTLGADLGRAEISIGLWVGQSLSPNKRAPARAALEKMRRDAYAANPFQVLQCPWCGTTFTDRKKLGYIDCRLPSNERSVRFVCPNDTCKFGSGGGGLPVYVIDEDLFDYAPAVIIGTVDKFAQISWDDRVGRFFGLGIGAKPPSLIIQDELHLISGPLGTVVGLYEAAIDQLCSRDGHVSKIIASTATIRRAQQQCFNLYARPTFVFPPQAIRAGDSYFALEDTSQPGRLYVGFMGTAVKSHQTALVRACSPLLQRVCYAATESDQEMRNIVDPYGTVVWYFNSLRELGHAATLCVGDIPEYLKGLCHRLNIPFENRRYVREIVELTSRRSAEEIPAILQQLEEPWRMKPGRNPPVDILLATNMIAVGVDVSRLGSIVVSGQPKSTSEYIQATSRVGRKYPGLVLIVYTQTKSRDRSHYESFVGYHQSIYKYVEPTSVTPFSPQARERGLRAVLIALARLLAGVSSPNMISNKESQLRESVLPLTDRIAKIDNAETNDSLSEIDEWIDFWKEYAPREYGRMGGVPAESTLVYPFGSVPHAVFQRDAWPLLTSMRNVDGACAARVLNVYESEGPVQLGAS